MPDSARVESVDAIKAFRIALVRFAETAVTALADAESDLQRSLHWLESEQTVHWQSEIRRRTAIVVRCKDAIREKRLFKNAVGTYASTQEEEKALKIAQRQLEEAEEKFANTRKYAQRLHRELLLYKGQVQRFATVAEVELPTAAAWLTRVVDLLAGYTDLVPGDPRMLNAMRQAEVGAPAPQPSIARTEPPADADPAAILPGAGPTEVSNGPV
jgi:hypothetical protein